MQALKRIGTAAAIVIAAPLLVWGQAVAPAPAGPAGPVRFNLSLMGHVIGTERVVETTSGPGRKIASAFAFEDRGTAVELAATLELDGRGQPIRLATKGRTYRLFAADADVVRVGRRVQVRDGEQTSTLDIGARPFFPVDNYAPIAVHEQLLRYWVTAGRPREILTAPAGPTIRIRRRGLRPAAGAGTPAVERVSIDGVVWGTETAWFEPARGRLLALTTWAGALPFQAQAAGDRRPLQQYLDEAVRDRMADLKQLTAGLAPVAARAFVVRGGTLIDGTGRAPVPDATVVVGNGGRIVYAGASAGAPKPARGVPVVDARGKWLIPGLWDMHAHASQIDWAAVYLASGVTTIRDLGGEEGFLVAMRNAIQTGAALGPRYLLAGLIDGPGPRAFGAVSAATPAAARAIVRRYKAEGFQEIKIYLQTPPALVPVIVNEAHRLGMRVTGHVPQGMTTEQVVAAGFDSVAHMQLRGEAGSPQATEQIRFFAAHRTVMDPTMSWNELSGRPATTPLDTLLPGASGLPRALARQFASMPPGRGAAQTNGLRVLKQARDAGLLVVPGTDKGVPGLSLPRELELYVAGGMTPLEAIQAASLDSARAARLDRDTGSITRGKRADFVLLDADPIAEIRNIRATWAVSVNGLLHRTDALWRAAGYTIR